MIKIVIHLPDGNCIVKNQFHVAFNWQERLWLLWRSFPWDTEKRIRTFLGRSKEQSKLSIISFVLKNWMWEIWQRERFLVIRLLHKELLYQKYEHFIFYSGFHNILYLAKMTIRRRMTARSKCSYILFTLSRQSQQLVGVDVRKNFLLLHMCF